MTGLKRFHQAQAKHFTQAEQELRAGRKTTHWIWYIFPQLKILGRSDTAKEYGIVDLKEACDYLKDPKLFANYQTMVALALKKLKDNQPVEVLMGGGIDALKLTSSVTLFKLAAEFLLKSAANAQYQQLVLNCNELLELLALQGYLLCEDTAEFIEHSARVVEDEKSLLVKPSAAVSPSVSPQKAPIISHKSTENLVVTESLVEEQSIPLLNSEAENPVPENTVQENKASLLKLIVENLIQNIDKLENNRARWFSFNSKSKIAKLTSISTWLSTANIDEHNEQAVLALIHDVCALKRNKLGFYQPHSVNEYDELLIQNGFVRNPLPFSYSAAELNLLEKNPSVIDDLIHARSIKNKQLQ